jgi:hypothetical protein
MHLRPKEMPEATLSKTKHVDPHRASCTLDGGLYRRVYEGLYRRVYEGERSFVTVMNGSR